MSLLIISLTYLFALSEVSSLCAYYTMPVPRPLQVCLKASGFDFNSHWFRCHSSGMIWEKFSSNDCSGSAKESETFEPVSKQCTGSGYDCNYAILRTSEGGNSCPRAETSTYLDGAVITNECFFSGANKMISCQSNVLYEQVYYNNDCEDYRYQDQISNKCTGDQWLSLPEGCGHYGPLENENTDTIDNDEPIETPTTTTITTTEPPLECKGAMVAGLSHYFPWITSSIDRFVTGSDTLTYVYQSPAKYYLIYPCKVVGSYALPFELYIDMVSCLNKYYTCVGSVVLRLLPRSTNPIIIEIDGLDNKEWGKVGATVLTINGKWVYNDLPLKNQRFSDDGVSGSYDIETILDEPDSISARTEIRVYIDGSDCVPALRFFVVPVFLFIECATCYSDNICGVLGHWDRTNQEITYPMNNQDTSESIDPENENEVGLFFKSWERTVDEIYDSRRLQSSTTLDPLHYPNICENYKYNNMKNEIESECDKQLWSINADCCGAIPGVCRGLEDMCIYDTCACIQSLNNSNINYTNTNGSTSTYGYFGEPPVNISDTIYECMENITKFTTSMNVTCGEFTLDMNEFYGEYNKFTWDLLAFFLLILIIPMVVGIYLLRNKERNDVENSQGSKGDLNEIDNNNNSYMIVQQRENEGEIR